MADKIQTRIVQDIEPGWWFCNCDGNGSAYHHCPPDRTVNKREFRCPICKTWVSTERGFYCPTCKTDNKLGA